VFSRVEGFYQPPGWCRLRAKCCRERLIIRRIRILRGTRAGGRFGLHWRSSRLSAHSPMRRTSIFVVVLLAVSAVAAHGSQAEPAHTHRKASASARGAHKAGAANVSSSAHASSTARRPAPHASPARPTGPVRRRRAPIRPVLLQPDLSRRIRCRRNLSRREDTDAGTGGPLRATASRRALHGRSGDDGRPQWDWRFCSLQERV